MKSYMSKHQKSIFIRDQASIFQNANKKINKHNLSLDRENTFNSVKEMSTPLTKRDFSYAVEVVCKICTRLRLTPSTQYLALFLAKNYLSSGVLEAKDKGAHEIINEVIQCCILLAGKMRERDIYCPLIPDIQIAGEFTVTEEDFKKTEVKVCQFFDWNIGMMTYYDFLEEFLSMGALLFEDCAKVAQNSTKPFAGSPSLRKIDPNNAYISPPSNKLKIEALIWESSEIKESGLEKEEEFDYQRLIDFQVDEVHIMTEQVERRAIDLAQQIAFLFLTDANIQKEIAFLIVAVARKEIGIVSYSSKKLTELYGVSIRDKKLFEHFVGFLTENLQSNCLNLNFDPVFRNYDRNGVEMLPPQMIPQIHMNRDYMMKLVLDNPKFKEKMVKLGRIDPKMLAVMGKSGPGNHRGMTMKDMMNPEIQAKLQKKGGNVDDASTYQTLQSPHIQPHGGMPIQVNLDLNDGSQRNIQLRKRPEKPNIPRRVKVIDGSCKSLAEEDYNGLGGNRHNSPRALNKRVEEIIYFDEGKRNKHSDKKKVSFSPMLMRYRGPTSRIASRNHSLNNSRTGSRVNSSRSNSPNERPQWQKRPRNSLPSKPNLPPFCQDPRAIPPYQQHPQPPQRQMPYPNQMQMPFPPHQYQGRPGHQGYQGHQGPSPHQGYPGQQTYQGHQMHPRQQKNMPIPPPRLPNQKPMMPDKNRPRRTTSMPQDKQKVDRIYQESQNIMQGPKASRKRGRSGVKNVRSIPPTTTAKRTGGAPSDDLGSILNKVIVILILLLALVIQLFR